jgi:hypothetical protein
MPLVRFAFALTLALFALSARAHDVGLSQAELRVKPDAIEVTLNFAAIESRLFLSSAHPADAARTPLGFDAAKPQLLQVAPTLCELRAGGNALVPRDADVQLSPDDYVSFHVV